MKILAFTDLHASITALKKIEVKIKKYKPDAIICCGDFTIFEQNIDAVLRKLDAFGLPVYLIHGNHEMDVIVKKLCAKTKNIQFVHNKIFPLGDYTVVAHGGGGFYGRGKLAGDKEFEEFIKKNKDKITDKLILLTHAPPGGSALDYLDWMDDHVGCKSYMDFIKEHKPILALSGHIHETFGVVQKLGKTTLCNPGPDGRIITL